MNVQGRPYLKALTPEAVEAVGSGLLPIEPLPYRVGRESRADGHHRPLPERRGSDALPNNDLYLVEPSEMVYVSREHFQIEAENGGYLLRDRASTLGTWVDGHHIGGQRQGGSAALRHGDVIMVGSYRSGFIFQFLLEDD